MVRLRLNSFDLRPSEKGEELHVGGKGKREREGDKGVSAFVIFLARAETRHCFFCDGGGVKKRKGGYK